MGGQSVDAGQDYVPSTFVSSPLSEHGGIESDRKLDAQFKRPAETLKVSFRPQEDQPCGGCAREGIIPVAIRNGRPGAYFQGASSWLLLLISRALCDPRLAALSSSRLERSNAQIQSSATAPVLLSCAATLGDLEPPRLKFLLPLEWCAPHHKFPPLSPSLSTPFVPLSSSHVSKSQPVRPTGFALASFPITVTSPWIQFLRNSST